MQLLLQARGPQPEDAQAFSLCFLSSWWDLSGDFWQLSRGGMVGLMGGARGPGLALEIF